MPARSSLSASLQHLNCILLADELGALPDAELVGRFVARRDESAFAALVRRYGVLVFGVCRRVLQHEQDAEDAFQATFLVFARDAASVQRAGAVGNWLYGVAHNVARKAKANRHRRELKEREAATAQRVESTPLAPDDLSEILDTELQALPDKYRAPVVLCDVMGLTTSQAAAEVGCPPKTLGTRLTRARSLLASRLTRRGVGLSPCVVVAALASSTAASGAVPPRLLDATTRAAVDFTTGSTTVSPVVVALTQGVTNGMFHTTIKTAILACGVVLAGVSGGSLWHYSRAADSQPSAAPGSPAVPAFTADDKKDDKPKPLSGTWVRKEKEPKLEFGEKHSLKISPTGDDDKVLIICEYTLDKDGLVKAKVTELGGAAKTKLEMLIPVGTEFSFKWKVEKDTAKLEDLKDFTIEKFKDLLEGEYSEKK